MAEDLLNLRSIVRKLGPGWLFDDQGYKFFYAIANTCDLLTEFAIEGQRAKFPELTPPDGLPLIGRDRRIHRGLVEEDGTYAIRLKRWLTDWKHAGGGYAIMFQLRAALTGYAQPMRLVNARGTWRTLNLDDTRAKVPLAGNWDWDGDSSLWARVWPIVYADPIFDRDGTWGDGEAWGDNPDQSWGSTASPAQVDDVREILFDGPGAVSGEGLAPYVIVSFDNSAFDPTDTAPPLPDGTWKYAHKVVGGVAVPARDPRAIYWPGP